MCTRVVNRAAEAGDGTSAGSGRQSARQSETSSVWQVGRRQRDAEEAHVRQLCSAHQQAGTVSMTLLEPTHATRDTGLSYGPPRIASLQTQMYTL